jgi:hypothetical protein
LDAVFNLQPWETGDDSYVWAVHELDRVDKHRLLISLAAANNLILLEGEGYGFETVKYFLATLKAEALSAWNRLSGFH